VVVGVRSTSSTSKSCGDAPAAKRLILQDFRTVEGGLDRSATSILLLLFSPSTLILHNAEIKIQPYLTVGKQGKSVCSECRVDIVVYKMM